MASSIGTLNEKPLHAAIKRWCAQPGDVLEASVDGFVVDILRGDVVIEVQTGGFSKIARKLRTLVTRHPVRLVHPIAAQRWILKLPGNGTAPQRRRSPKRRSTVDLFEPLVSIPDLVAHPSFSVEVLLTHEEEVRRRDRRRGWRRGGWVVVERRLLEVIDREVFVSSADLARLLPASLPDPFQTAELARALARPRWLAQKAAYCLARAGAIQAVGKSGNARLYSRTRRGAHTRHGARTRRGARARRGAECPSAPEAGGGLRASSGRA